ncbi:hypothetical protein QE152_g6931 [Popillia japonica]|uniref:Uncharacterized protein n=1 Tax=Popillia japonica TaxID=7064 RepID=A0AAW1MGQ8_POPJA
MANKWNKDTTIKFVEDYTEHECLWNVQTQEIQQPKQYSQSEVQETEQNENFHAACVQPTPKRPKVSKRLQETEQNENFHAACVQPTPKRPKVSKRSKEVASVEQPENEFAIFGQCSNPIKKDSTRGSYLGTGRNPRTINEIETAKYQSSSTAVTFSWYFTYYYKKHLTVHELLEEVDNLDDDAQLPDSAVLFPPNANAENTDEDSG